MNVHRMRGVIVVVASTLALAGCSSAAAPTPQIIYVTAPPAPSVAAPTPIIVYVTPSPAASAPVHQLGGTFVLRSSNSLVTWDNSTKTCSGQNGYSDIVVGAPIVVKDPAGTIIASGLLDYKFGDASGHGCSYTFTIPNVPDEPFYSVEVSNRGAVTYSAAQMNAMNWTLALTLGS